VMMHIIVTDASAVQVTVNPALDTVSQEELTAALQRHSASVGSALIRDITIPVSAWEAFSSSEKGFKKYNYIAKIAVDGCLEKHFPSMAISIQSEDAAAQAEMSRAVETSDGYVTFWAVELPTEEIIGTIQLRSENLTDYDDVASDEEVDDAVDDVFGQEGIVPPTTGATIATDAEVAKMNRDIFGV